MLFRKLNVNKSIILQGCDVKLTGIGDIQTGVLGYVVIKLKLFGHIMEDVPLAVVHGLSLPCCFLLGENFLTINKLEVDFGSGVLHIDANVGYCCEFRSNGGNFEASVIQRLDVASFWG